MNPIIAKKYAISFENRVIDFEIRGKEIWKCIHVNLDHLEAFLSFWRNAVDINESLLPDIDDAINGVRDEIENGSETIDIYLYQNRVDFYYNGQRSITIPISDFREIVIGWRDFINTKPYNATKQ